MKSQVNLCSCVGATGGYQSHWSTRLYNVLSRQNFLLLVWASLVPRPRPAFRGLQYGKAVEAMCDLVSEPDPRKIEKEGLVFRMGWKCTLRPVCRRTSDWLLINILMCVYWNANRTRAVFAFCFVLESCKHQAGKIRTLLRVSGSAESSTGYGRFSN